MQADLGDPTSLPATMVGVHTIIDCATARPEEPTAKIDWVGKRSLIQCAQVRLLCLDLQQHVQQLVCKPASHHGGRAHDHRLRHCPAGGAAGQDQLSRQVQPHPWRAGEALLPSPICHESLCSKPVSLPAITVRVHTIAVAPLRG